MVRRIVCALVLVLVANAARVLACEISCAAAAEVPHASPCHQPEGVETRLAAVGDDLCASDLTLPALTAPKVTAAGHAAVTLLPLTMRAVVQLEPAHVRLVALPRPESERSSSPHAAILRI